MDRKRLTPEHRKRIGDGVRRARGTSKGKTLMSYEEAMQVLSRDERFHATVYAMNTLLMAKGLYSPEEFEFQIRQFAQHKASK